MTVDVVLVSSHFCVHQNLLGAISFSPLSSSSPTSSEISILDLISIFQQFCIWQPRMVKKSVRKIIDPGLPIQKKHSSPHSKLPLFARSQSINCLAFLFIIWASILVMFNRIAIKVSALSGGARRVCRGDDFAHR